VSPPVCGCGTIGTIFDKVDQFGIADNTIVIYTTDNGPHQNSWPDAGTTPFRCEKNTNWEGAFRVPAMIRWPGHIKAGSVANGIFSGLDWFPTLLAAGGARISRTACSRARASPASSKRTIWMATISSTT